ncbi:MAG: GTP cyclohydrolase I [Oscillospiraceae bacterium]|nr:GTP cyclohydrolase I [Oscillospiraceae bacterium]
MNIFDEQGLKRAEELFCELIELFGGDPGREGLRETPGRCAKMYREMLVGMKYTNDDIAEIADKCFEEEETTKDSIVILKDIEAFSFCEHHLALIYNLKLTVAYKPAVGGRIIGISKIARIADMVCKRLNLQERIGRDILEILSKVTGSPDVAVIIEGEHSCMSARGIRKPGAVTKTAVFSGCFDGDKKTELLALL